MGEVGAGELYPDDGSSAERLLRRTRGIGIEVLGFVVLTALFPLVAAVAAIVDLTLWVARRKPWMGVRLVAFAWWFLLGELRSLLALLAIYLVTGGPAGRGSIRRRRMVYRLRQHWLASILGGLRVLFGLRFVIEGREHVLPGPIVLLLRHASIIDNALGDTVVGRPCGLGLRFVLKRELRSLPVIDIGARWVPTAFVRRASADTAGEVARLRGLAQDLRAGEGIAVYPEGTRHTPQKLARAQEVIRERQPEVAPMADRLRHVLPPRLGGPLALIDAAQGTDVVLCGHVGLDGFEYISDIWSGGLVRTTVRVRFWRFPASEIPADEPGRIRWLYDVWQTLDDWVGAELGSPGGAKASRNVNA